jgi:hypothetical protein
VFVLTPMLVCGLVVTLSSAGYFEDRRWVLVLWTLGALIAPLALEALDVIPRTWQFSGTGLMTWGTIHRTHGAGSFASLIFGQTALGLVVVAFALVISRKRRDYQRRALRQAWHLQQMLPRGTSQLG